MPGQKSKVVAALALALAVLITTDASAAPVIAGAERVPVEQRGAVLFNELGCANCHGGVAGSGPFRKGADLLNLSERVEHDWILEFLDSPQHDRMPAMFDSIPEKDRPQAIGDVAAWLGTLSIGKKLNLKAQRHANAERGSALFHEVGCVACHAPTADFKPARPASKIAVPMPDLKRKTDLPALAHFLTHTNELRPDARMPQIPLQPQEAIDIAAHLLDFQSSDPREAVRIKPWPKPAPGAVERGRKLVESLNCAACHDLPGIKAAPLRKLEAMGGACVEGKGTVRYQLGKKQQDALIGYLPKAKKKAASADGLLAIFEMAHFDRVPLAGLNCYACHERGGIGGPTAETDAFFLGDPALGDAGRIPPPLTKVGLKLKTKWLSAAVRGDPATRVRPYLKTRMPTYPKSYEVLAHSVFLPADLIREDVGGIIEAGEQVVEVPQEIAEVKDLAAGRKLVGAIGGMNCITCHSWGDRPSIGIKGMDISALDQRLHGSWFRSYLLDPASFRPGTLMPALWPNGKSAVKDVLGGDTEQQIGAIWAYIRDGKEEPEGFPKTSNGEYELIPTDRPIVQRTFLAGIGTRAILVGFPGGINLAYDAGTASPRMLWRGRFFDAYGTWFSRFAPYEKPLGKKVFTFAKPERKARYLGYELDAAGNPTFLSRIDGEDVSERFEVKDGKLLRTLTSKDLAKIKTEHPPGIAVEEQDESGSMRTITYRWK